MGSVESRKANYWGILANSGPVWYKQRVLFGFTSAREYWCICRVLHLRVQVSLAAATLVLAGTVWLALVHGVFRRRILVSFLLSLDFLHYVQIPRKDKWHCKFFSFSFFFFLLFFLFFLHHEDPWQFLTAQSDNLSPRNATKGWISRPW